jgi:DNA repair protein RecO
MSHHIYQTEGIVLSSSDVGEADIFLKIFSKEFGLIYVKAIGIRNLRSKLRHGIQQYSLTNFSMVRAKNSWKLVNVDLLFNIFQFSKSDSNLLKVLVKALGFLEKFIAKDIPDEKLFTFLKENLDILRNFEISPKEVKYLEVFLIANILQIQGILEQKSSFQLPSILSQQSLLGVEKHHSELVKSINYSIRNTDF